ncbi:MAG TPA: 3-hydroxyacyl-CoA dehydrogenase NAD-binding domain-containing protein [Terriglobales bacterium]|nr:3-hydroxyacyl-CoA dehydrogenase NAD-binding domain-containing protein [Terriglobales bacterium]
MGQFSHEIRNGIAWVTFDSGGMNTLSQAAVTELNALTKTLAQQHAASPLQGVILKGNRFGLGAGANIGELLSADRDQLAGFIDFGHETLYAIEEAPFPWVAVVDGFALGGIYELALACRAIVATEKSTVGFPEIRLNIFPGLGGTQRMPRRSGLINATDPFKGDAGFTAILTGKNFRARQAAEIRMIDAVIPEGEDVDRFAEKYLRETVPTLKRELPEDLANGENLKPMVLPTIQKATMGRPNPRAPYVALDTIVKGATLPLREANRLERDAFLEVVTSAEGKAGMRFFFTQQAVQKLPKGFAKPRELKKIGIDGADGYMGNAITWLALEAGYEVVAHVPLAQFAPAVAEKLKAKYARQVQKGSMSQADVDKKVGSVKVTTEIKDLQDCDLVIEARMENREIKAEFYRALGNGIKPTGLVASNSSSMGPGILGEFFAAGGGSTKNFVNLHFFSPAEHPMMQLVEIIRGKDTSEEAVATAHAFVRSINKTPVILNDGSPGFLVNAGLAAYMLEAEKIYREGTPVEQIDQAMRESIFPMGPFELGDQAGLDIAAGMFDTIAADKPIEPAPLVWKLREAKRFGVKSGAGVYDYKDGKKAGEWPGLAELVPNRGSRVASKEEIIERCAKAVYSKARELCDRKIVGSEEECDLSFVFGIGFAMYLGGPIFYGQQHGWR